MDLWQSAIAVNPFLNTMNAAWDGTSKPIEEAWNSVNLLAGTSTGLTASGCKNAYQTCEVFSENTAATQLYEISMQTRRDWETAAAGAWQEYQNIKSIPNQLVDTTTQNLANAAGTATTDIFGDLATKGLAFGAGSVLWITLAFFAYKAVSKKGWV